MKKDVEVLVIVICDQTPNEIPDPKVISHIRSTLSKTNGIIETYLAPNTADIVAFASWHESEIPTMVEEIKKITGVKKVETKILVSL